MEFRVLGKLEVVRDGTPVDLGAFRQRALLAQLEKARDCWPSSGSYASWTHGPQLWVLSWIQPNSPPNSLARDWLNWKMLL